MRMQRLVILAGLTLCLVATTSAWASSFTVENESSDEMELLIFDGDDSVCLVPAKTKTVEAGGSLGVKCDGAGKHRCKVFVLDADTGFPACYESPEHLAECGIYMIVKVATKSTLVIEDLPAICMVESDATESLSGESAASNGEAGNP